MYMSVYNKKEERKGGRKEETEREWNMIEEEDSFFL